MPCLPEIADEFAVAISVLLWYLHRRSPKENGRSIGDQPIADLDAPPTLFAPPPRHLRARPPTRFRSMPMGYKSKPPLVDVVIRRTVDLSGLAALD